MAAWEEATVETRWTPLRSLDDIIEIERVPFDRRVSASTTYDLLRSAADCFADRPALTTLAKGAPFSGGRTISYRDLFDTVTRTANLFRRLGLQHDESVSILLPNIAEFQFAMWGAEAAGRANPINPFLDVEAIGAIVRAARTRILITLPPGHASGLFERAKAACPPDVVLIAVSDEPIDGDAIDFAAELVSSRGDRLDFALPTTDDAIAALYHTGGTTGKAKLVTHSHRNEIANAWQSCCCFALTGDDVVFNAAPLFHVTGSILLSLAPFSAGAHVVMGGPDGFRMTDTIMSFWNIVEAYRISVFCSVPTVYAALLNSPVEPHDISCLRLAICGAAPLPLYVAESFIEKTGAAIIEGYGMTETCSTSIVNPRDGERRAGAAGIRAPYQDVRIAILDDAGAFVRNAKVDEAGALLLCGPNVTPAYLPASANDGARPLPGWLDTGDTARMDDQGYIFLTGRKKDLIIRGGHNIDPALVEDALAGHPAVAAVAAVGKPDGYAGELPVAYVVRKPGYEVKVEDLMRFARDRVAERPAAPSDVYFVDALPMTAVGKVFKPTLRLDAVRRACLALLAPDLGNALGDIVSANDPSRGTVVEVAIAGDPDERLADIVRRKLSTLSLHCDVRWSGENALR
ncbi:acyl-CoA synthetase [Sphingopyxis fribergensis]